MMPPFIRRCPDCGHVGWTRSFRVETDERGRRLVECPSCQHRFEPVDNPLLN
ncbi:hypothetical protein [Haloarcula nitratireducens]|uniref:Small CPxCG-related zinc finger protein n=1 Tax=Haloarcula nitratireducens TaxID=2487749 RepID=A0AAW4PDQ8_9EURY|nr:hypothetical protein [Halomicroarcula nitratireducens]MBX0296064.1 hypothetical protein [Halomicroarcula nitratireducens]